MAIRLRQKINHIIKSICVIEFAVVISLFSVFYSLGPTLAQAAAPKRVKGGVLFTYSNPKAKTVHIAGSFNNWADNEEGKVKGRKFLMSKGKKGVWRKRINIGGGKHTYKYVINGTDWLADPSVERTDQDGNSVLIVKGPKKKAASRGKVSKSKFALKN